MKVPQQLKVYPTNDELTKKHNFLANVPKSERKSEYLIIKSKDNATKTTKCNVHLSQRDSNVFHSILSQWYYKSYDNKKKKIKSEWISYDLSQAAIDLGMNNYFHNDDYSRRSSNKTNNEREIKRRIDNILSFVIELQLESCTHKFHFIEETKIYLNKPSIIDIKLSPSFLEPFLAKKIQIVPLLVVNGEYEQKMLEYLLTKVQYKQNLVGIHKGNRFRFRAFNIKNCVDFFQVNEEYNKDKNKIRRKFTKALNCLRQQINNRDIDIRIPEYRYKNGTYEVIDYCYLEEEN